MYGKTAFQAKDRHYEILRKRGSLPRVPPQLGGYNSEIQDERE